MQKWICLTLRFIGEELRDKMPKKFSNNQDWKMDFILYERSSKKQVLMQFLYVSPSGKDLFVIEAKKKME